MRQYRNIIGLLEFVVTIIIIINAIGAINTHTGTTALTARDTVGNINAGDTICYTSNSKSRFLMTIKGNSMEPNIHGNTVALITRDKVDNINVGDIICYKSNNKYIVHRVESINSDTGEIIAKGDNNKSVDSVVVTSDNYVGKLGVHVWLGYLNAPALEIGLILILATRQRFKRYDTKIYK